VKLPLRERMCGSEPNILCFCQKTLLKDRYDRQSSVCLPW
jgi:hypothetical protein